MAAAIRGVLEISHGFTRIDTDGEMLSVTQHDGPIRVHLCLSVADSSHFRLATSLTTAANRCYRARFSYSNHPGARLAKKAAGDKSDRSDPKKNKSLAIRNVLAKMPGAKASAAVEAVKNEYGHKVSTAMVCMIKTKSNMARTRQRRKNAGKAPTAASPMHSAANWFQPSTSAGNC